VIIETHCLIVVLMLIVLIVLKGMFLLHWSQRPCNNRVFSKDSGLYMAQACAHSCHQRQFWSWWQWWI